MQNLVHGIKGKVVVVTGASSGIGEATVVMLAERASYGSGSSLCSSDWDA
jgi:hypothetical protein